MVSMVRIQRRQRPIFIWVIALVLLASQVLAAGHYHSYSHTSNNPDTVLHTIEFSSLQYVYLAAKLKDQQQPHHHSHDESTCGLCNIANLSWSKTNIEFAFDSLKTHSFIANASSVFTSHSPRRDSLPRAPPSTLFVA